MHERHCTTLTLPHAVIARNEAIPTVNGCAEIAFPIHRDRLFLAMTKERLTIKVKTKLATKWRNNRVLDETL